MVAIRIDNNMQGMQSTYASFLFARELADSLGFFALAAAFF